MNFNSILDLRENPDKEKPRAAFFEDLNIEQIIMRIRKFWGDKCAKLYYYFPADKDCESYRREIFRDIKNDPVYDILYDFVLHMKNREEYLNKKKNVLISAQKQVWHFMEVGCYCDALTELVAKLSQVTLTSRGFNAFYSYVKKYTDSEEFQEMKSVTTNLSDQLSGFRLVVTYDNDNFVLAEGQVEGAYENFLDKCCPDRHKKMKSPFMGLVNLTQLEQELIKIFMKKQPEFFKRAEQFYKKYAKYESEVILQFASDITYYLSFRQFEKEMIENGFAFTEPTTFEEQPMKAEGLYDLALACVNCEMEKQVVSNEMHYEPGERFFVLTGPNQGGKTTFARSLGQLIYLSKMGLDVPADFANIHYFKYILTHFSVEESIETGRGKLKEELIRLAPMMYKEYENTFVIINELFTTAANYDACIMGKNVLEHFIGQNCQGIYVTHLRELSELGDGVVSIRALLDEQRMQSYKIVRAKADDTACAVNQVNKYRLRYEQLKERLITHLQQGGLT